MLVAQAQFQPTKGSYPANLERIRAIFAQVNAMAPVPDVLCFPETAMSGYFVEGGVEDVALTAGTLAADLDRTWREVSQSAAALDVVIGFYERWEHTLHNSAMYVRLGGTPGGEIRHVHRKIFLPTYGLFDEHRFVEPGLDIRAFGAPWGRTAMLVCEDIWHSLTSTIAALDGAEVLFVCSAAPARGIHPRGDGVDGPASVSRWERLVRDIAEEHGIYVVLTNLVGSEGGKSFQGGSLVVGPAGEIRSRAPVMEPALVLATIDLADLGRARADSPLLADLRTQLPHLERALERARAGLPAEPNRFSQPSTASARPPTPATQRAPTSGPLPVVTAPGDGRGAPPPLAIDPVLTGRWLVGFIRDELSRRGYSRAIVGLSGGVDSAVTAALAARALGAENVTVVRMPYRTSHPDSLAHAQLVADWLGTPMRTIDISDAVDGYLKQEPDADPQRRGNVMARVRMTVLFDLSARYGALPLGTGNKSERLLGYFTWHADDSPPINPLGDLFKTQVWALARQLGVPGAVVDKPPTADLVTGQTDEGDFGISYAKADEILNWLLHGWTPDEIAARGFASTDVELVRRRLEGTHWKRRPPTVAMLTATAIGESYLRPVDY